jgi:hypothetical protein
MNDQKWTVAQQIIQDLPTGLTIQFETITNDPEAPYRLRIYGGNLPNGNREILFNEQGTMIAAGTALTAHCKPTWLTQIDDDQSP